MHAVALLFSSIAAASALSSKPTAVGAAESTFIERRDYGGETCDTAWTDAEENGAICWERGYVHDTSSEITVLDVSTGLPTQCREECERNPDCKSMAYSPGGEQYADYCYLYSADLSSMGFYTPAYSNDYWGSRECWKLSGMCEMHSGSFEPFDGAPLERGMVHPWSTSQSVGIDYGTSFTVVNSGTVEARPVPRTPYGFYFAKATINDYIGVATLSQDVFPLKPNNYTLSYSYNFASFQLGKGRKQPKNYFIQTVYCNSVIDVLELPVSKADKKWKKHSKQVFPTPCEDASNLDIKIMAAGHGSTAATGLFEATIAIDNVKFELIN